MELAIVGDGTAHKQQPQEPRCQCESGATNKEKLVDLVLLQISIVESLLHWTQSPRKDQHRVPQSAHESGLGEVHTVGE